MIVELDITFTVFGEDLIPEEIEKQFGIKFTRIIQKGSLLFPKSKIALDQTNAEITKEMKENDIDHNEILRIAKIASRITENSSKYNITDSSFRLLYFYCGQCALGFDSDELLYLSKASNGLAIDCVQLYDSADIEIIDEFTEKIRYYNNGEFEKEVIHKHKKSTNKNHIGRNFLLTNKIESDVTD